MKKQKLLMVRLQIKIKMNYKIIGKYIKNLNFNIPNPKIFYNLSKDISNYKIHVDIRSDQIKENIIEVLTSINLTPNNNVLEKIDTKIVFATIVELANKKMDKEVVEKIILVDVPTEIYYELRKIFVNLFENSGFKDVKISENVDFQKLYNMRKVQ